MIRNVETHYVYDAGGNVLAIYDNNGTALQQKEVSVYAAGRIGIYNRVSSAYQYELTDHLGNVRVVLNQNKTSQGLADVVYYSDYYPYGMPMGLASNDYRYGYQGQYAEADKETAWNAFTLRNYDAAIGRWLSIDPYGQYVSPYVGMGNNPLNMVDPDGGFADDPKKSQGPPAGTPGNPFQLPEVLVTGSNILNGISNWWNSQSSSYWNNVSMASNLGMFGRADFSKTNGEAFRAYMLFVGYVSTSQGLPGRMGSPINYGKGNVTVKGSSVNSNAAKGGMTDLQLVTRAAQKAEAAIGGTGGVAGTLKHTYAKNLLSRYQSIYGDRGFSLGSNYFKGPVGKGFLDVVNHKTMTIYDFKFGNAVMSNSQFLKYSNSFLGYSIQVIRP